MDCPIDALPRPVRAQSVAPTPLLNGRTLAAGLQAVSPLATLQRGYAIVTDAKTGAVVRDAGVVSKNDRIEARLAHGSLQAVVDKTRPD